MSFQVPGEKARRAEMIAGDMASFGRDVVLEYADELKSFFEDRKRDARALEFWNIVAEGADKEQVSTLAEVTTALVTRKDFGAHFEKAWKKAAPRQRKTLLAMLNEARSDAWDDDEKAALTALYFDKKGLSPDEQLVVGLTTALEACDGDEIDAATRAIVRAGRVLAAGKESFEALTTAVGMSGDPDELVRVGPAVPFLGLKGLLLERVLAQTIGGAQLRKDIELERALLALVPKKITWEILAYNLACNAALRQDRPRMLAMTKVAVSLGKTRSQFLNDADFKPYLKDKDFLALLPR